MIDDPRFIGNAARVAHSAILDEAIGDWSQRFTADELKAQLDGADVPNSKVYNAKDCAEDPQYLARRMVRSVADPIHGEVQIGRASCGERVCWSVKLQVVAVSLKKKIIIKNMHL